MADMPPTEKVDTSTQPARLRPKTLAVLALPSGFTDIALLPFAMVIPVFYAKTTGLSIAIIGTILLATRLFDAISDPAMGLVADRFETKYGRRKPWIVVGSIIFAISFYHVFTPTAESGAVYFAGWVAAMYLGYTIFSVPKNAWHVELSRNYDERQRVVGYATAATFIGSLFVVLVPIAMSPFTGSTEFSAEVLATIAVIVAVGLPLTTLVAVKFVPKEERLAEKRGKLKDLPSLFTRNRPFFIFIIAFAIWQVGSGVWSGVTFLYIDSYLNLGDKFVLLILIGFVARLLLVPFWMALAKRMEKHVLFCIAAFCNAAFIPFLALLGPGDQSWVPVILLTIALNIFDAALFVLPPSILGDTADYDTHLTGFDRTATYKSIVTLILKSALAIGAGSSLIVVGWFGYEIGQENSASAVWGLKFAVAILPAILFATAGAIMLSFPLTRRRHSEIVREVRERRSKAALSS